MLSVTVILGSPIFHVAVSSSSNFRHEVIRVVARFHEVACPLRVRGSGQRGGGVPDAGAVSRAPVRAAALHARVA